MSVFHSSNSSSTVYFATAYYDVKAQGILIGKSITYGDMDGPLPLNIFDPQKNIEHDRVYRLNRQGVSELLWAKDKGYILPEYDPEYVEYLKLRKKFADA